MESLKSVEHCWLNEYDVEERENILRAKCRSNLEDVAQEVIERYKNDTPTFYDEDNCKILQIQLF